MDASIVLPKELLRSPQAALLYFGVATIATVAWSLRQLSNDDKSEIDLEKRLGKKRYDEFKDKYANMVQTTLENKMNDIMFAICGRVNTGKSALINAIRGLKDKEDGAAQVGNRETTTKISSYEWLGKKIYDFPGSGTMSEPDDDYFMRRGLPYFHGIILMRDSAIQQADIGFARKAVELNIPIVFVQSRMDEIMPRLLRDGEIDKVDIDSIKRVIHSLREEHIDYMKVHAPDLQDIPCYFISSDSMRELMKKHNSIKLDDLKVENMSLPESMHFYEEDKLINELLKMLYESCENLEKIRELKRLEKEAAEAEERIRSLEREAHNTKEANKNKIAMEEVVEKFLDDLRESLHVAETTPEDENKSSDEDVQDDDDFEKLYYVPSSGEEDYTEEKF